jgi:exopolysaccharide production protein ExoY
LDEKCWRRRIAVEQQCRRDLVLLRRPEEQIYQAIGKERCEYGDRGCAAPRLMARTPVGMTMKFIGKNNLLNSDLAGELGIPVWKRLLDLFCILATAPLWLPVMLVIAVVIKIASPGPAFFQQERIGYRGRRFTCFKFRTMVVRADARVHQGHLSYLMGSNLPMKKLDAERDPRVIPCGLFLRSLGLDELPQLFNVLRGDMSLVGPRPCVPYEYENYAPHHRERFQAAPGLTGLWQVSGKNRTTFEEMISLDVYYAKNKSLLLDLKIIFKTVPAIVSQTKDLSEEYKPVATISKPVSHTTVMQN